MGASFMNFYVFWRPTNCISIVLLKIIFLFFGKIKWWWWWTDTRLPCERRGDTGQAWGGVWCLWMLVYRNLCENVLHPYILWAFGAVMGIFAAHAWRYDFR